MIKLEESRLAKFKDQVYRCCRCGLCKIPLVKNGAYASCPARQLYGFEPYYARGRMLIAREIIDGNMEYTEELASKVLSTCTTCGFCDVYCPLAVESVNTLEALREDCVKAGFGPLPNHRTLIANLDSYDNAWGLPRGRRGRWAKPLKVKDASKEKVDILFYVGCTSSYDETNVGIKTARAFAGVLQKAGVDFGILGEKEVCCGSTLLKIGLREKAEELGRRNLEIIRSTGAKRVMMTCAGCYKTLSIDYPHMFGDLGFEATYVPDFLAELVEQGKVKPTKAINKRVTYHDPCHSNRHRFIQTRDRELSFGAPRKVLKSIPGLDFVEMAYTMENSMCCGAGGGVRTHAPDQAVAIGKIRVDMAQEVGADILASSCPFCEQNLSDAVAANGSAIQVRNLSELLLESLE